MLVSFFIICFAAEAAGCKEWAAVLVKLIDRFSFRLDDALFPGFLVILRALEACRPLLSVHGCRLGVTKQAFLPAEIIVIG